MPSARPAAAAAFACAAALALVTTSATAQTFPPFSFQAAPPAAPPAVPPAALDVAAVPGLNWQQVGPLSGGSVPPAVLVAGVDAGVQVGACRVRSGSDLRVGKLAGMTCLVPMNGAEIAFEDYEVLTGAPWLLRWPASSGRPPPSALIGGRVGGAAAAVCQVDHMGGVHPGMVIGDRCHFGLNGKEIMSVDYRYAEPNPPGRVVLRHVSGGWVPPGAITAATEAGADGLMAPPTAPAVCLAQDGGDWLPGTLDAAGLCAHVRTASPQVGPQTGQVARDGAYTVIIGDPQRVVWVAYEGGSLPRWDGPPENSVRIGGASRTGTPHAVCRTQMGGQLIAGRVQDDQCLVPLGGVEFAMVPSYQVLHYIGDAQTAIRPPNSIQ